ncbi:hypothetical protein [Arthrobacter globiformis]|uniref:hypothetical protein n=1 Tax=Arthrobacter globiformis TaxID=1665 RepID=UPI00277DC45B|nr:hypothetical protein [Arthrobacter globiformis]MDQ0864767.1 hypothetical protein [Arthrobacter globiformis]
MNTKEATTKPTSNFFSGHVARPVNAHELVTNNNPSIRKGKEAPGHTNGHQ